MGERRGQQRIDYHDVPAEVVERLAAICLSLPETIQEPAWTGVRWRIRTRTFAHAVSVDTPRGSATLVTFRSPQPELDVLRRTGHPFFSPGWGKDVIGMVLGPDVDWDEVAELLTESYCVLAPKKLAATVGRPADGAEG